MIQKKTYTTPATWTDTVMTSCQPLCYSLTVDPSQQGDQSEAESRRRHHRMEWDDDEDYQE